MKQQSYLVPWSCRPVEENAIRRERPPAGADLPLENTFSIVSLHGDCTNKKTVLQIKVED